MIPRRFAERGGYSIYIPETYGGTFCYVSGLDSESPFTHLGSVSATFHPMLAEKANHDRLRGSPVYLVHGVLDWMFPVEVARQAQQALSQAGADVTYREIRDLAHTDPREINMPMLAWLYGDDSSCATVMNRPKWSKWLTDKKILEIESVIDG